MTSTITGVASEVSLGRRNGLDHDCVVSLDNVVTIPVDRLGPAVGTLFDDQEASWRSPSPGPSTCRPERIWGAGSRAVVDRASSRAAGVPRFHPTHRANAARRPRLTAAMAPGSRAPISRVT
ncbi:MAG: hypothetical protein ACRCZD_12100 [Phycicoccus sp.]